jgi:hypothetical protein
MRQGRKSSAQTPAPKSDKIYGSRKNTKGSASTEGSSIFLSSKTIETLQKKLDEFKKDHPNAKNITLGDLKKVYRRGSGAYSKSHRPTISGGAPNSRGAWSFARVNKFLEKAGGKKVKKAYIQDDDLMANGGEVKSQFYKGLMIGNDGTYKKIKNFDMELTESLSISDIDNKYPEVSHNYINKQVHDGIKIEMEHTKDPQVAKKIALDHLNESIHYYEELEKMEKRLERMEVDDHFAQINPKYEDGGEIDEIFTFSTPTKEKSKLTYIQQVLVRTSDFKKWFGDWELAANRFLADGRENFEKHYKEVSKVIDYVTLEPRVVYHGTMSGEEFFKFDVTKEKGVGRPYAYFAVNKEYAKHFTTVSQRQEQGAKPHLYECFLNVRHPFMANGQQFVDKNRKADAWLKVITGQIVWDKYRTIDRDDFTKALESTINSQIGHYVNETYANHSEEKFWKLMARDSQKEFKFFLLAYGYDGIFYTEEFSNDYDVDDPSQFTQAVTIFDAKEVKLADARNTQFDPLNSDIRFEEGGHIEELEVSKNNETPIQINKLEKLQIMMAKGGKVHGDGTRTNDAKDGGLFVGKSHDDGGIKAYNKDSGQPIEVEGNEVIINKRSVADNTKREFEGEMLTNKEILSKINEMGGGVSFANGGELKHICNCNGKKYNFGGELLEDYVIVDRMSKIKTPLEDSKEYLENLMQNIYG